MENYIQYLAENGQVKICQTSFFLVDDHYFYQKVSGIKEPFSVLAVFFNNHKRCGVFLHSGGNLESLSIINSDFFDVDLVSVSSFENSETEIIFKIPRLIPTVTKSHVVNFPEIHPPKFFKVYDSPQYRTNNFLVNMSLGTGDIKWLTKNVFRMDWNDLFQFWNVQHFDNFNGVNDMPADGDELRVLDRSKTFMLNGMYVKFTCLKPTYAVGWYHFNLFQDVRTNEVYLTFHTMMAQITYNRFDFNSLQCVDGGFIIEKLDLGLKLEIRNKYFI